MGVFAQTFVNDVPIIQADLVTFGGMVHVIGGVLMPVLNRCDQYSFTIEKVCDGCFSGLLLITDVLSLS